MEWNILNWSEIGMYQDLILMNSSNELQISSQHKIEILVIFHFYWNWF